MTDIHINKHLTGALEEQGYHLVDKHEWAKLEAYKRAVEVAQVISNRYQREGIVAKIAREEMAVLKTALEAIG